MWLGKQLFPGVIWLHALAGAAAIFGQIFSIFLWKKQENGRWRLHGGAGGATTLGAVTGLFPPAVIFVGLTALAVYIFVGYASLTTISIALNSLAIFIYRYVVGAAGWQPIIFGVLALILVIYALRPNLIRLRNGDERMVGLRLYFYNRRKKDTPDSLKRHWF